MYHAAPGSAACSGTDFSIDGRRGRRDAEKRTMRFAFDATRRHRSFIGQEIFYMRFAGTKPRGGRLEADLGVAAVPKVISSSGWCDLHDCTARIRIILRANCWRTSDSSFNRPEGAPSLPAFDAGRHPQESLIRWPPCHPASLPRASLLLPSRLGSNFRRTPGKRPCCRWRLW